MEERKWNSSRKWKGLISKDDLLKQISDVQLGWFRVVTATSCYREVNGRYVTITGGTLRQIARAGCLQGNFMLLCVDIRTVTVRLIRAFAGCSERLLIFSLQRKIRRQKHRCPFLFDIFLFLLGKVQLLPRLEGTPIDRVTLFIRNFEIGRRSRENMRLFG